MQTRGGYLSGQMPKNANVICEGSLRCFINLLNLSKNLNLCHRMVADVWSGIFQDTIDNIIPASIALTLMHYNSEDECRVHFYFLHFLSVYN